ncbi:hypothetical protein TMatcc_000573 [Talaromyces marneffei ATCC 18224]|uniref:Pre-mRNA splicing factor Clf1 n=2 Tax=Talaromyces marneffei TaxID=37727 RepID=B6QRV9_TALMQ|nr:uncharacterized protein EYB26_003142 [Talaromyces marneffei]EEA20583.1 conserved hypothetical protein [Talaromyces marneffei ATCC 18224]KAE8549560.1 hypothetical protein EYB25_008082 [Talaromyces marneffei]QGA15484.1 hypothetical protein EYB26_003142 [Talaromyces marneffei]
MSCPEPPSALDGRCSVVYNNTIYVYTPSALLSLPLEQGAEWTSTNAGQGVTDAVCVTGTIDGSADNQALYVVGGTTADSTYMGLQRYSFANKKWESLNLGGGLRNTVNHSAIYLPGTASILVYAGSNDGNQDASTTTFEIPLANGGTIQNRNGAGIAAGIKPTLLPWDSSTAVYVGGTPTNTEVFLYHGDSGWGTSQISLASGIPSTAGVAIQSNADGSKFLEIFDMSVSPNNVTYVALLQPGGSAAFPGEPVTFTTSPSYNGTLASTTTRNSFSLAQSYNGLVVIAGGSSTDAITVFNQTQNSWVNTTKLFYGDAVSAGLQHPIGPSSTTAPTTSATAATTTSASATTTAAAFGGTRISTGVVIGATLGCLLGVAAILIILLVVLRRFHRKNGTLGTGSRRYGQDKDRLSFQDQGIEPLTMAAVPMARSHVPSAVDSLNMISGKFENEYPGTFMADKTPVTTRSLIPPTKTTLTTITTSQADQYRNNTLTPITESHSRGDRSTDEGWGKYFQDGEGPTTDSPRTTMNSDISQITKSDYRGSMWPHEVPERTTIALSALDGPRPLGQVASGSPSTEHLPSFGSRHIHQGQSAHISSADSVSFVSEEEDDHDRHNAFSSGVPQSVHDGTQWTHQPWNLRPPSSNYTDSFYQSSAREPSGVHEPIIDARSHGRRSSGILHDDRDSYSSKKVNSDMSWLNLHADK